MSTNRLRIGELVIDQDSAPQPVLQAMERLEAAKRRGDPPGSGTTLADATLLMGWIKDQERKYPNPASQEAPSGQ